MRALLFFSLAALGGCFNTFHSHLATPPMVVPTYYGPMGIPPTDVTVERTSIMGGLISNQSIDGTVLPPLGVLPYGGYYGGYYSPIDGYCAVMTRTHYFVNGCP